MSTKEELNIYLENIKKEAILTSEQERQITEAFRAGIDAQRNREFSFLNIARICIESKDQSIKELTEQVKEHNWQEIKVQAAVAAMQGVIISGKYDNPERIAIDAVECAKCLTYQLKESFNPHPPARTEVTETGPFTQNN